MSAPVLVTGANGRIGTLLMRGLAKRGWSMRGYDVGGDFASGSDTVRADITDMAAMIQAARGCGAIIHLAATPNAKPGWDVVSRLNIHGTRTVLEAARRMGVGQVVFASSIHTVGALPSASALGPDLPAAPSGIYGVSKLAGEALLQVYALKAELSCIAVRICSFRPAPQDARELRTWIGPEDTVDLFDCCLRDRAKGYRMIWGVSANSRLSIDDPTAVGIGYRPQQDAEAFAPRLALPLVGSDDARPWAMLGGPVADDAEVDFRD